jgi:hypothetical protein
MLLTRAKSLRAALLLTVCATLPMAAATINFDTGGTNVNGGSFGNVRTFVSGTTTITVTSYGLTGNGNTTFQTAQTGQFSPGLGICNQSEGLGCGDPNHQADNSGPQDFFLIQFSSAVNLSSIFINPFCGTDCPAGGWDRDITYYTAANLAANLSLAGLSPGTLPAGFGAGTTVNNSPGGGLSIPLTGNGINSLVLGTAVPNPDALVDRFKLKLPIFGTLMRKTAITRFAIRNASPGSCTGAPVSANNSSASSS